MRSVSLSALAVLLLASSAAAHFTLDYPLTRGFDEDLETQNFCGGYPNVLTPRQPWYYRNGPIQIDSHHDTATVNIYISYDVPSSAQSFLATSNGTSVPPLRHDLAIKGQGEFCFHANATGVEGVQVGSGTNATLMVEFISTVHGRLYQCSDVVFTDDMGVGANVTCTDSLTASASASGSGDDKGTTTTITGSAAAATSSAPARSNSNGAAGMEFGMVGVALVPALLAGALSLA